MKKAQSFTSMHENEIAKQIVDKAYHVHNDLGPGLLESVYEEIMAFELKEAGFYVSKQQAIPVTWKDVQMELGFRADLVIENKVIIEVKSVEAVAPVHKKQLLTYLKITGLKLGLLINFNEQLIKGGLTRVVNGL